MSLMPHEYTKDNISLVCQVLGIDPEQMKSIEITPGFVAITMYNGCEAGIPVEGGTKPESKEATPPGPWTPWSPIGDYPVRPLWPTTINPGTYTVTNTTAEVLEPREPEGGGDVTCEGGC